ncbi:Zinc finger BED domain-containing protein 5 [Eumeta japonica]|uniref:Zinc finger BED domain-containing protein 5 n=1 Tax=Eumeta variegata TaxID=151549 RepID=A0A4C1ZTC0_EUMVA|nr:Zinc finger BED domain-containing protein 5 [Eumeta japonica]
MSVVVDNGSLACGDEWGAERMSLVTSALRVFILRRSRAAMSRLRGVSTGGHELRRKLRKGYGRAKVKYVPEETTAVLNFIKARPSNSNIFHVMYEDVVSIHKQLLLQAEVRWLSRG